MLWRISPLAYWIVIYGSALIFGLSAVFIIVTALYRVLTGKSLLKKRARSSDFIEKLPTRSTPNPLDDRGSGA